LNALYNLWLNQGSHALLHHLNAVFGYREVNVLRCGGDAVLSLYGSPVWSRHYFDDKRKRSGKQIKNRCHLSKEVGS